MDIVDTDTITCSLRQKRGNRATHHILTLPTKRRCGYEFWIHTWWYFRL